MQICDSDDLIGSRSRKNDCFQAAWPDIGMFMLVCGAQNELLFSDTVTLWLPKGNWITFTLTDCYFQLHVIHELCQLPAGAVALPASPPLSGQLVHSKDAGWETAAVPGALCRWLINVKSN